MFLAPKKYDSGHLYWSAHGPGLGLHPVKRPEHLVGAGVFTTVPLSLNKTEISNSISNQRCLRTLVSISFIYYFNSKRKKHGPWAGPAIQCTVPSIHKVGILKWQQRSREPAWPSRPGPGCGHRWRLTWAWSQVMAPLLVCACEPPLASFVWSFQPGLSTCLPSHGG